MCGVLASRRPKPTLDRTLEYLKASGFSMPIVNWDLEHRGQMAPYLNLLSYLYKLSPDADVYGTFEDDICCCRNMKEYIEKTAPLSEPKTFMISAYIPEVLATKTTNWHGPSWREIQIGHNYTGGLALIMPNASVKWMFENIDWLLKNAHQTCFDRSAGKMCQHFGWKIYNHDPSLVDHIGLGNSATRDLRNNDWRRAGDTYVGDDFNALHFFDENISHRIETALDVMKKKHNSSVTDKCIKCGHYDKFNGCIAHTEKQWGEVIDNNLCLAYYGRD
jgi:hypothetical protein